MKQTILIVEDDIINQKISQRILKDEYQIFTAETGEIALNILEYLAPDLILLDIYMPVMDGFEVQKRLNENEKTRDIPVIFVTAESNDLIENKALEAGAVDFVRKPFHDSVLRNRIRNAIEMSQYRRKMEQLIQMQSDQIIAHTERLNKMQKEIIISMANLIESRDGSTGGHIKRTGLYVELLVNALNEKGLYSQELTDSYIENIGSAAYLHDIGKIKVSDMILQKPGRLTKFEYDKMKEHASTGAEIIRMILEGIEDESYIKIAEDVSRYHHEKWDGTGYPYGIEGTKIPLSARIMAIADVFDALTSKRCYKEAINVKRAFQMMEGMSGSYFDPDLVRVFLELQDELTPIVQNYF